jgi:hypothetical protein
METSLKHLGGVIVCVLSLSLLASGFALAADDSKVKAATHQVEQGAKKIPKGKVGKASNKRPRASARRSPKARSTAGKG